MKFCETENVRTNKYLLTDPDGIKVTLILCNIFLFIAHAFL